MNRELCCVSWNIHGYVGRGGVARPERAARVLRSLDADIVALQEVDASQLHDSGRDRLSWIAEELGLEAVAGPARLHGTGYFGNALLTRLPVERVEHMDISVLGREPRAVLDVVLNAAGTSLQVLVTHFGLRARERERQASRLIDRVREHDPAPALLAGDFNEWSPRSSTVAKLDRELGRAPALRTFPARFPLFALDRIWVRPFTALRSIEVVDTPAAREASDHLPLVARVDLSDVDRASRERWSE